MRRLQIYTQKWSVIFCHPQTLCCIIANTLAQLLFSDYHVQSTENWATVCCKLPKPAVRRTVASPSAMGTWIPMHNKLTAASASKEEKTGWVSSLGIFSWPPELLLFLPLSFTAIISKPSMTCSVMKGNSSPHFSLKPNSTSHQLPAALWITLAPALQSPNHPFFSQTFLSILFKVFIFSAKWPQTQPWVSLSIQRMYSLSGS